MNDEILKLAKECVVYECSSNWYVGCEDELEAFYRAAYNNAIEDAAKLVEEHFDPCEPWLEPYEVRALEMK